MFFFDMNYLMMLLPALALAMYANFKVKRAYKKYRQIPSGANITGAQAAAHLLRDNGLQDVHIEEVRGELSDHYDPRDKVVRLSSENYHGSSIAGLSVAAHEVGHAIQDAKGYSPLRLRHSLLPVASFGSKLAFPLLILGFIINSVGFIQLGVVLFAGAVLFQLVTLPVEFNASSRAMAQLSSGGYLRNDEISGAKKVLDAAALTYVAAALTAVMQLLYYVMLLTGADD